MNLQVFIWGCSFAALTTLFDFPRKEGEGIDCRRTGETPLLSQAAETRGTKGAPGLGSTGRQPPGSPGANLERLSRQLLAPRLPAGSVWDLDSPGAPRAPAAQEREGTDGPTDGLRRREQNSLGGSRRAAEALPRPRYVTMRPGRGRSSLGPPTGARGRGQSGRPPPGTGAGTIPGFQHKPGEETQEGGERKVGMALGNSCLRSLLAEYFALARSRHPHPSPRSSPTPEDVAKERRARVALPAWNVLCSSVGGWRRSWAEIKTF
ncbi:uncharacterized protein LOC110743602 [Papio anubis]|uniref:uncharacterized protein LOC110743602 n=1 Tax=Papio anubis TaxID=9555 RepID=UPI000B7AFB75|nr:uncharacterized protein LOC110743602 [Papio anubis]